MNNKSLKLFLLLYAFLAGVSAFAQKSERGVASIGPDAAPYIDKKEYSIGGTFAMSKHSNINNRIVVVEGINSGGYSMSVRPTFIAGVYKNVSVGVSAYYTRNYLDIASAGLKFKDVSIDIKDYYTLEHQGGARVFGRYYFPIGKSARVALFADLGIEGYYGQGKVTSNQKGATVGTYQTSWGVNLGVFPGISVYITRHFAMEASLGYLSVGYNKTDQVHNQVAEGTACTVPTYFLINPLSLSIGAYFPF